jgi:hypothetical protein
MRAGPSLAARALHFQDGDRHAADPAQHKGATDSESVDPDVAVAVPKLGER